MVFDEHNGPIYCKEVPVPLPKPHEILIRLHFTGVCHSDLHAWKGDWPMATKLPLIGGHEGVGEVVAMGDQVTSFEIGDYAGIRWLNSVCLRCEYCLRGEETCCVAQKASGYTVDGTFQQFIAADALQTVKVPAGIELAKAAPVLCAGLTAYKALKKAHLQPGNWCVVIGCGGGLGSFAVQYANAMGVRVIGIDSSDKRDMVTKSLKAEVFIDFASCKDIVGEINTITDGGAHAVLNFSVSEKAMNAGLKYVRTLGTFVIVGMPPNAKLTTDIFDQIGKQFNITASSVGSRQDTVEALDFFQRGAIDSQISIFKLSELPEVFRLMQQNKILGRVVVDNSQI